MILTNEHTPLVSALFIGTKHEVIDNKLVLSFKQVFERQDSTFRAMELVFLVELDHRKFSKLREEGVAGTNQLFLFLQEGLACRDPFGLSDNLYELLASDPLRERRRKCALGCMVEVLIGVYI